MWKTVWKVGKAPQACFAASSPLRGAPFCAGFARVKASPIWGGGRACEAGGALAGRLPPTKKSSPALQSGCFFQQFCLKLDLAKGEIITVVDTLGGFGCHRLCIGVTRAVGKLTAGHAGAGAAVARAAVIAVAAGCAVAGPTAALTRGSGAARAAVVAAGTTLAVTAGAALVAGIVAVRQVSGVGVG